MLPRTFIAFLAMLALLASACASPPSPTATPSPLLPSDTPQAAVVGTPAPSVTPVTRATLPPTFTATPETPTTTPTLHTPVLDLTNEALKTLATLPACASFTPDRSRNPITFTAGEAVTVYWGAAQGAAQYRVTLFDINYVALLTEVTRETSFTFSADFFTLGAVYGWEVRPYDSLGVQMCFPIGDELRSF